MFVSRRRFILKTCGTTTPLRCVRAVLALARDVAGHACVHNVFYSRREFARPQAQLQPHDNFDSEVSTRCLVCNGRVRDGRRSCTTYSISSDIASSCVPQSFLFVILFHLWAKVYFCSLLSRITLFQWHLRHQFNVVKTCYGIPAVTFFGDPDAQWNKAFWPKVNLIHTLSSIFVKNYDNYFSRLMTGTLNGLWHGR